MTPSPHHDNDPNLLLQHILKSLDTLNVRVTTLSDQLNTDVTGMRETMSGLLTEHKACRSMIVGNGRPGVGERLGQLECGKSRVTMWLMTLGGLTGAVLIGMAFLAAQMYHVVNVIKMSQ